MATNSGPASVPPPSRSFFRIVASNPPTVADFMSGAAQGGEPRSNDPDIVRLWDGISVYATMLQARRKARGAPYLGQFIAEIAIPANAPARFERSLGRGHFTVWADPHDILNWVISVVAGSP